VPSPLNTVHCYTMGWFGWFILVMDTKEGMAKPDAVDLIATIRTVLPECDDQSKCGVLLAVLGAVGTHKKVQSKGKGINIYTKVGDKIHIRGNMGVYVSGARSEESVQAILNSDALKGLVLDTKESVAQADELSASDVTSQMKEYGL